MAACTTLYVASSYLLHDFDDILWFYLNFHHWIAMFNLTLVPIFLGMLTVGVIGHVLLVGAIRAIPAISACGFVFLGFLLFYLLLVKPKFSARFRSVLSKDPRARILTPDSRVARVYSRSAACSGFAESGAGAKVSHGI